MPRIRPYGHVRSKINVFVDLRAFSWNIPYIYIPSLLSAEAGCYVYSPWALCVRAICSISLAD